MAKEKFNGKMVLVMKDISSKIRSKALENILGRTSAHMWVTGLTVRCTEKEHLNGQMARGSLVNIKMIKKRVKELFIGVIKDNIKEDGQMVFNTEMEFLRIIKARPGKESGKMARE
jgi:hypothetical protein